MNVIQTNIVDFNLIKNDQASKILFTENLIEHFAPLFYEELRKKQEQFSNNMTDIKKLKKIISEQKQKILKVKNDIDVENDKNQILQEIDFLNRSDVLYGKSKMIVQNVINSLDDQLPGELKKRLILLQKLTKENKKG